MKTQELTDEWRSKGARRIIAGIQPIEASPVFRGAGVGTGTVAEHSPITAASTGATGGVVSITVTVKLRVFVFGGDALSTAV